MNRRQYLAASVSGLAAVSIAGCTAVFDRGDGDDDPPRSSREELDPEGDPVEVTDANPDEAGCRGHALEAMRSATFAELSIDESENINWWFEDPANEIGFTYYVRLNEEGEVVERPDIEVDELVKFTPRTISVSLTSGEDQCTYEPVIVRREEVLRDG